MKAEPALHSCPYIKHTVEYSPLNSSFPASMNRMQSVAPQPRRRDGNVRRCPITARPPSLPALLACVLTPFEKLAWLGQNHRPCFPNRKQRSVQGETGFPHHASAKQHVFAQMQTQHVCTHARTWSGKRLSGIAYIYTHTYTHAHRGRHHDADQLHLERPSRGAHVLAFLQVFTSELVI